MKSRLWILALLGLVTGSLVWAADEELQENERQILGVWQAGKSTVEFHSEGKASVVEGGVSKEGTYEINGDWLFVRIEGEEEKSGLVLIDGDRMTVDEHAFRRVRAIEQEQLIGKWTSEKADIEWREDGTVTVFAPEGERSGRITVDGKTLRLIGDDGDTEEKPFENDGDVLVIDGSERLERVGGERNPEQPLEGQWRHDSGSIVEVTPEGRFRMSHGTVKEATYVLEGAAMTVRMDDGEERRFALSFEDGTLVLDGEIRLERVKGEETVEAKPAKPAGQAPGSDRTPEPYDAFSHRYEAALDAFLEARKGLALSAVEGLGVRHPESLRKIAEARYLLKRCQEEADLLEITPEGRERIAMRIEYYGAAFEQEIAEWGSR